MPDRTRMCSRCGGLSTYDLPGEVHDRTIRMGCHHCKRVAPLRPIAGNRPPECQPREPVDERANMWDVTPSTRLPSDDDDERTGEFTVPTPAEARDLLVRFGHLDPDEAAEADEADANRDANSRETTRTDPAPQKGRNGSLAAFGVGVSDSPADDGDEHSDDAAPADGESGGEPA